MWRILSAEGFAEETGSGSRDAEKECHLGKREIFSRRRKNLPTPLDST